MSNTTIEIELADMVQWESFARVNEDALIDQYGSLDDALKAATDGGLVLGGGAAPEVHVYFAM